MITKLLIANRGEIACRIIRTCHKLGIKTVAVYSDADVQALHVMEADEAIHIGGAPAIESYLVIDKIIGAAIRTEADAIHPGFGFLAENAAFATACENAGLIFVGPSPHAIETMGNKAGAKILMEASDVPLIPGYHGKDQNDSALLTAANEIGFPLMVKAAAGGGGKGMRIVTNARALTDALESARRESRQAFGSAELILERALLNARHIEIQIFGDSYGNVIHLGERDCSVQRRHQKVVEEAPAVGISAELREQLGATAVRAAQSVNYVGAGTVEFLLDANDNFYFLEMNTRIQVEHPVTEMITGFDLVEWQLLIAEGEPLPIRQNELILHGHAIEARIYSENPARDFSPVTGAIALWQPPSGEWVRVDSGLKIQDQISIHYDPMVAKVIAHGPDRKTALRRLHRALCNTHLIGLSNNIDFLKSLLKHPVFTAGEATTHFINEHMSEWQLTVSDKTQALIAATIAQHKAQSQTSASNGFWRNSLNRPQQYRYIDQPVVNFHSNQNEYDFVINDNAYAVSIYPAKTEPTAQTEHYTFALSINGHRQSVIVLSVGENIWVSNATGTIMLTAQSLLPKPANSSGTSGSLRAPMPGVVLALLVSAGDKVEANQPLLKLEAMKMEHTIRSNRAGTVAAVHFTVGEQVEADAKLLTIE